MVGRYQSGGTRSMQTMLDKEQLDRLESLAKENAILKALGSFWIPNVLAASPTLLFTVLWLRSSGLSARCGF